MLKAKLKCQQVNQFVGAEQAILTPVTSDSEENKTFSQYTPSGKLELMITNPSAVGFFKPGKDYFLDITEAPQ